MCYVYILLQLAFFIQHYVCYLSYSVVYFFVKTGSFNQGSWLPYLSLNRVMLPPQKHGTCCPLSLEHSLPACLHILLLAHNPHHLSRCSSLLISLPCLRSAYYYIFYLGLLHVSPNQNISFVRTGLMSILFTAIGFSF